MQGEVTVTVAAPPAEVFALVSDVTRIGEFSPETFDAEWLDGADGPAVGARFRGHVKRNGRGPVYWTTCKVTWCEPERDFGFGPTTPEEMSYPQSGEVVAVAKIDIKGDATSVAVYKTPGPAVTAAIPGSSVTRAQPSAQCTAACSWRKSMTSMPRSTQPS